MNQYLTALEAMSGLLDPAVSPLQMFNKKSYKPSFEQFYHKMVPAFDAIESLYASVGEPMQMIDNMAQAVVDQAKKAVDECKRRTQKDNTLMNLNMQLAVYVYPSVLAYKGASSQPLVDSLSRQWKEAFPKTNVTPATFETIEKGFHRKFCYITTAVCRNLNADDNCYELTLLRGYRDGYMSRLSDGEDLIRSYYDVAPTIVKHIERRPEKEKIYQDIWSGYIRPCIRLIESGENEACLALYGRMVKDLKEQYFN